MKRLIVLLLICNLLSCSTSKEDSNANLYPLKISNKYGYINNTGEVIISPQFDVAWPFSDGLALVEINNNYGYINEEGKIKIPPTFDGAGSFENGFASVRNNGNWGHIDTAGNIITPIKYEFVSHFENGLARVSKRHSKYKYSDRWKCKYGFTNTLGEIVIDIKYSYANKFSEGLAGVEINNKWGYIDTNENIVIDPKFENAHDFQEGLAAVKLDNKWGFINKGGDIVIEPEFVGAKEFSEGLCTVSIKSYDDYGVIDTLGNWIINPIYDYVGSFSEGYFRVKINDKWGFIDKSGSFVINPIYNSVGNFENGISQVSLNGKDFYIKRTGEKITITHTDKASTPNFQENENSTGRTVYTLYTHSRGFSSTKYFRTVQAKVLEVDGNDYKLEYLENCYSGMSLSGKVKGLSKGYTYWERDGDVYDTRQEARIAGKSMGFKLSE